MIDQLLEELRRSDVRIWAEGDRLKYDAPRGALTDDLLARLRLNKEAILKRAAVNRPFGLISDEDRLKLPEDVEDAYPLSMLQAGMVFHSEHTPGTYHSVISSHLQTRIDIDALQTALEQIVARHPMLRTEFRLSNYSVPLQLVHKTAEARVEVQDLRHLSNNDQEDELTSWLERERRRPFDWSSYPLVKFWVHLRADDRVQFTFIAPHAIFDGWSDTLFITELFRRYQSILQGENVAVEPPPSGPFRDFVALELEALESEECSNFWKQKLRGWSPAKLPDWSAAVQAERGLRAGQLDLDLSREVSEKLRAMALQAAVPLKSVLLAAHLRVVSLLTGQSDVVTGLVGHGRPEQAGGERIIGLFLNALPFRLEVTEGNWLDLARRTFEAELEILPYRRYPLAQIQKDRGQQVLYDTLFTFAHFHLFESLEDTQAIKVINAVGPGELNLPLSCTFIVDPHSQNITVKLNCDANEIPEEQVQVIAGYYERTLVKMADDPHAPIQSAKLLSEQELHKLLEEWKGPKADYSRDLCMHELFERQVETTPGAIALEFEDEQLSYLEVNRRANQLAHHLMSLGVGPEVVVATCMDSSVEMIVGLLGIMKAGGAYLPLDPGYPLERLSFMLEDAQIAVLLTREKFIDRLPNFWGHVIALDTEWENMSGQSETNPMARARPDNLAYVIYTSGSTGQPKGVMVSHGGFCNMVEAHNKTFGLQARDRVLQFASYSFDASVWEIFMALAAGARLCLGSRDSLMPGPELIQQLRAKAITTVLLPPRVLAAITSDELPALRVVIAGGEECALETVRRWKETEEQRRFFNAYGPTEASVCATMAELDGSGPVTIGGPVANTELYILDHNLQPVPIGVSGEIHLGGIGLARGYLNQPEFTAEKFIPDPFNSLRGARLYKTGDRGRWLPDGNIEFFGRIDNQVKIRGYRIELGEIEAVLGQHDAVSECVVVAHEDERGDRRLLAYVVRKEAAPVSSELLRSYLKEKLPEYLVPSIFVLLDAFPLTPSGKVDRKALPSPDAGRSELKQFVAPRSVEEKKLAEIWEQVLGIRQVGINDNFFELGGDSILSIQITARASQAGLHFTTRQIFQHLTIAELVTVAGSGEVTTAEQGMVTGEVPLTPIQHWFFEPELEDPHHWNQAVMMEVREAVDLDVLEQAMGVLSAHHDALRLRFRREEDGWRQELGSTSETIDIVDINLSSLSESEQHARIEEAANELQRSLNLEQGPLVRAGVFDLGKESGWRLLIVIHHLAVDGVSWRILLEDLQTIYGQLKRGEAVQLPAKTTSFKQWAEALKERAESSELEAEAEYWEQVESEAGGRLPVDKQEGENTEASAGNVTVWLEAKETEQLLKTVPAVYNTQINDVLLTALVLAMDTWTGERRVLVDLEGHGREEIKAELDVSRTVGWFTTIYPVVLKLSGGTVGDEVKGIKEQLRGVPGRGIGYGLLRYLSSEEMRMRMQWLPQAEVSFNYLGQLDQVLERDGLLRPARESRGESFNGGRKRRHLLDVNSVVSGGQLRVNWTYSENRHQRETIEKLAKSYIEELRSIIEYCQSPEAGGYTPSDFPLAKLEQQKLDSLIKIYGPVEDIYPLSPLQNGFLFHTVYSPGSGTYFEQLNCSIEGELNIAAFKHAWQRIVDRHSIFRTAFVWEGLDEPLQVVIRNASLPWQDKDWRNLSAFEQQDHLSAFLSSERKRDFELNKPPLMRMALFVTGNDSYEFVWSHHHLLLDGWCMHLLLGEVFKFYQAYLKGEDPVLERSSPYREYIEWLLKQDKVKAEEFWRRTLKGFTARTLLAGESSSPAADLEKRDQNFHLPAGLSAELQELAQHHQLTLNTLLQGAWALLMSRYTGEEDVVFGVVVSGRSAAIQGIETSVGLFINALPFRVRVSAKEHLINCLKEIQQQQIALTQYEHSALFEIQGWSELPRGQQLFDTLFAFLNYPAEVSLSEQKVSFQISGTNLTQRTNYPLVVTAIPGSEIVCSITYDHPTFDDNAISRMFGHFRTLLEAFVSNSDQKVSEVSLLSESEKRQLIVEWNDTAAAYERERCVQELFEEQVARTPDELAVVCGENRLSYAELNERANQLGRYLRAQGVGVEDLVGICMGRSAETVIAVLGVLKSGAAYVPLDPNYPKQRLELIVKEAGMRVVLTEESLWEAVGEVAEEVICVDGQRGAIEAESKENTASGSQPENLAYVIYTSGSTGTPKGVMVQHRSVLNLSLGLTKAIYQNHPASQRVSFNAPLAFDCSVQQLFQLLQGRTVCIVPEEVRRDGAALLEHVERHRIDVLDCTPSQLRLLLAADQHELPPIVLVGGEPLDPLMWQTLGEKSETTFYNMYGPTECAVDSTIGLITREQETPHIGRPVTNVKTYILDGSQQLVPVGVAGELYIGGEGLARGYLNRPDLTAERFIPDAFSGEAGKRLYRTGDLVRYLPDGLIEFLGRTDYQIKVRGYRIELGDIEATLGRHESVRESVVLAREDTAGEKRLVAYVVGQPGAAISTNVLRTYLKENLPEYMVPSAFVLLDALPLTTNGKVDRKALPAPDRKVESVEFKAPTTTEEEILAGIWTQVLGVEDVGIDDNFFELGGDSIRSIQVFARAKERGLKLKLQELFEHNTIRSLAQAVKPHDNSDGFTSPREPFSLICEEDRRKMPDFVEDAYPLTMLQAGMVFHSEMNPEQAIYRNTGSLRVEMPFDPDCLEEAIQQLTVRHQMMRTSFDLTSFSEPLQLVHKSVSFQLGVDDLRHLSPAEQDREISRWLEEERKRSFNWAEAPLLRFHIHWCGDENIQFSRTEHHAFGDGWSMATLMTELFQRYYYLLGKSDLKLELTPTTPYRDFVALELEALKSEEARQYWQRKLEDLTIVRLPRKITPGQTSDDSRMTVLEVPVSKELSDGLKRVAHSLALPIKSVLLAAHLKVMSLVSGHRDVITGVVSNGRPETADGEQIIGLFLNTLPFRLRLGNGSWLDLITEVFENEREVFPFRRYPLAELQRTRQGQPLYETAFNFTHFHVVERLRSATGVKLLDYQGFQQANFPLMAEFMLIVTNAQVALTLEYDSSLISEEQIKRLGDYYAETLRQIAETPHAGHDSSSLLSIPEQHKILVEWNDTEAAYERELCVQELFEEQVARTPDEPAVIWGEERLSYAELNERANQLGRYLRAQGVGVEDLVGICMGRSAEMVIALLGVLKSGGAYVPLDPNYPKQRLELIVKEAGMRVVLTERNLWEVVGGVADEVICVNEQRAVIEAESKENFASGSQPENLAYVIYTSGSTGIPKGVAIEHRSAAVMLQWAAEVFGKDQLRGVLASTSVTFDLSVFEIFAPLICGGCVIGADNALELGHLAANEEVTLVNTVPSAMKQLLRDEAVPKNVRIVNLAGEALPRGLVDDLYEQTEIQAVYNLYGPSEDTTYSTWAKIKRVDRRAPSIGRPIANTQVYVVDTQMQPVPVGVAGELCLSGEGLARGYLNRPELTAERFVPNVFSKEGGKRLYKTGDLARWREDGELEFLGRSDYQVKVRGYRIELSEIEAALAQHESVKETVVIVREDKSGDKTLVAYLVPGDGAAISVGLLRGYLKEKLPAYMIPSVFVTLDALPLTPNGKLDRGALPLLDGVRVKLETKYETPRNPVEEQLAQIWTHVLKVERVGIHDNFFDLGGHSLLATQIITRTRQLFQIDLPMPTLFEAPTVAGLAANVIKHSSEQVDDENLLQMLDAVESLSETEVQAMLGAAE